MCMCVWGARGDGCWHGKREATCPVTAKSLSESSQEPNQWQELSVCWVLHSHLHVTNGFFWPLRPLFWCCASKLVLCGSIIGRMHGVAGAQATWVFRLKVPAPARSIQRERQCLTRGVWQQLQGWQESSLKSIPKTRHRQRWALTEHSENADQWHCSTRSKPFNQTALV